MLLASFGIGYKLKAKLATLLFIVGGTLLYVSKIIEPSCELNLYLALALPYVYILLIMRGLIIFGLDIWLFKKTKRTLYT